MYEELAAVFPDSTYVKCQLVLAKYNLRDFDEAQQQFETMFRQDPYRLDQVPTHPASRQASRFSLPPGVGAWLAA